MNKCQTIVSISNGYVPSIFKILEGLGIEDWDYRNYTDDFVVRFGPDEDEQIDALVAELEDIGLEMYEDFTFRSEQIR